jgi:F-type H+-transporting ATPase subunit a
VKNPRTLLIVAAVLALVAVGFLFVRSPKPIIEIKAETITDIGPFPLVNTFVASTTVVIFLIAVALLATRNISLIPGKLQNLVEAVTEAMLNTCINTAGEKNGRRFFPVIMTIFTFIWIANWMALLPFFNAIGSVEKVSAEDFHKQAAVMSQSVGIRLIKPNQKALEFNVDPSACGAYDTTTGPKPPGSGAKLDSCVKGQRALAITDKLAKSESIHAGDPAGCAGSPGDASHDACLVDLSNKAIDALHSNGKELGVLVPYFRSMNTDINSPLSIAIVAVMFIEFWGITSLGFFRYATKFLNVSSPINFIVGLIEFVAEVARLISFTFRLFGNMLAGEILLLMMIFLIPFVLALPFYALEVFVGVIQAFVFALLTLVFGALASTGHEGHDDHPEAVEKPEQLVPAAAT